MDNRQVNQRHAPRQNGTGRPVRATEVLLGSASERRAKILRELGIPFSVLVPDVTEAHDDGDPAGTARRNARLKHEWCRARDAARPILTADTVIDFQGRCVGKPETMGEAVAMFRAFAGLRHDVLTAVGFSVPSGPIEVELAVSGVVFRRLDDQAIRAYFDRVNPLDKAGAYDIDQHDRLIVESYTGSFTNIMGLPAENVRRWWKRIQSAGPSIGGREL